MLQLLAPLLVLPTAVLDVETAVNRRMLSWLAAVLLASRADGGGCRGEGLPHGLVGGSART